MTEQPSQESIWKIIGDHETFLNKIFANLKKAGFALDEFEELDHIAYRTESLRSYEIIKADLLDFSAAYSDKIFGGRPVLVCRLKTPLVYGDFAIGAIEVLAPKESNRLMEGLEHAEFVIKTTLEEFREKHGKIVFNLDALDRNENPELTIDFEDCAVKFHRQSLLEVRDMGNSLQKRKGMLK